MIENLSFKKLSIIFIIGLLGILTVLILWPILTPIIIGLLLSYTFFPIYKKLVHSIKNQSLSALIVIIFVFFLIFIPLWFIIPLLLREIFDIYLVVQNFNAADFIKTISPFFAENFSQDFGASLNNFISNITGKLLSISSTFIVDLPNLLLKSAVVLFVFFFGMRDSEKFKIYIMSLSPFSEKAEKNIVKSFKEITNAVIFGQIIIGIVQGVATGIGLFIFGIPNALTLTIIATFVSILPMIGPWLVWVPVDIYLFLEGNKFLAFGFLIYGIVIISWVDNIIRPYLVSRRTNLSSSLVLIGMIGGLIMFGTLGLIIGPLILSYLLLVLDSYRENKFSDLFS